VRVTLLINGLTGYLDAQYRQLHKLGNELLVVTPSTPVASGEAMADTAFTGLGTEEYARVIGWTQPPRPRDLVATVNEFAPDAVLMTSWNYTPAYRAVMKALPREVVRILIMDNLWRAAPKQWLGRMIHRLYVDPVADAAMVPSDRSEFYARRLGFSAADIIRGSLSADVDTFASPPRTAEELASRRRFLYVGRLVWHKGPDLLADAYRRYRDLVDDPWELDVVGLGPMGGMLRPLPGVRMHGFLSPAEVAAMMRAATCYLLPSHIEPYGVAVHEAAAAGLPILCADFAGAAPGFVQDGYNGWIVPSGDARLWAQSMARISSLPADRLAAMSDVSRALSRRISPAGWARNLHEEIVRRRQAGGGRLG
jgi:glycosyltransferase involved in cell wall biosynthesis